MRRLNALDRRIRENCAKNGDERGQFASEKA